MHIDVYHVLLGRPWQFERKVIYDGRENTFTFEKYGRRHALHCLKDEKPEDKINPRVMLVGAKSFLHQLKETEVNFVVVGKRRIVLTCTRFDDFPIEVKDVLNEHVDILVNDFPNELPLVRSISHHIDLILGASFQNKDAYMMTSKEKLEIRNQVQDILDKGLVRESLSPCVVPIVLSPNNDGVWRMYTYSSAINKITIRYMISLDQDKRM